MSQDTSEFFIACLCAEWCGTCREYREGFEALAQRFPQARFVWLDVEDEADLVDDYDVENFPTLLIQRDEDVLFFGTMLPHHDLLARTVESFHAQSAEESRRYARSDPLRLSWQTERNLRRALREQEDT